MLPSSPSLAFLNGRKVTEGIQHTKDLYTSRFLLVTFVLFAAFLVIPQVLVKVTFEVAFCRTTPRSMTENLAITFGSLFVTGLYGTVGKI
nr:hypothetical protein HmN_000989000 [Hymenolepis microstoma]